MSHRLCLAGSILLWACRALAETLSWQASVQEAIQHNPDLVAAQQSLRKAQAQYRGSFSPFLPQLSADASATRSNTATSVQSVSGSGVREEYSLGLSARQSLFSGFGDKAEIDRTAAELVVQEASAQQTSAAVGFELKNAFASLLYAQEQLALAETIASRRTENVRLVELRYQAGREHKGSYLRSKASSAQAQYEVSQAKRALRVAQRDLARVLGRSEFETLQATGTLQTATFPQELPDFKTLLMQTPVYLQAQAESRASGAGLVSARSQFFPELSGFGSLSRRGDQWPPETKRWSVGLDISFPFFPGARHIFDVQSALADKRLAQANVQSVSRQTMLDLEESFASYQDTSERTQVQKEFVEAATVRAQIARSQYTSGLLSFEDWDLIENDLMANQKTWLSSLRDAVIAEAAWQRTQGKGPL